MNREKQLARLQEETFGFFKGFLWALLFSVIIWTCIIYSGKAIYNNFNQPTTQEAQ